MSLVNRVSVFFLASLIVVLAGYSAALYGILTRQLQQRFDEQLHGTFRVLVAAVEVETDDVKFEPSDHTIALGTEDGEEDVRWAIFDERGKIVDRSQNLTPGKSADDELLNYAAQSRSTSEHSIDIGNWRVLQKRLAATHPKPASEREPEDHEALVVTVGRAPHDLNVVLRLIGGLVIAIPVGVGLLAAIVGRRICRKALQPLQEMVLQARGMSAANTEARLPVNSSGDELSELAEAFNAVLDRLYSSLERQQRFAGNAAHQLRTPLTTVIGHADVALRRPRSAEEYRDTLEVVRSQSQELQQIIESLLFLARSQHEGLLPDVERISLSQWLGEYVAQWSTHPRAADLKLDVRNDAFLSASPVLLKQLLNNLVGNAFKYSSAGSQVRIEAKQTEGAVELSVIDLGVGISQRDLPEIFQPFFRSEQARQSGTTGAGLGLAIAEQIAAVLGSELSCESEVGKGSRVTLRIAGSP